MAISKNTKNKYNKYFDDYSSSTGVNNAKNKLAAMAGNAPELANTYDNQLKQMYNNIKSGNEFSYSPENDAAYRRFADEYNALAGLAVAGNQQQAQELTGGYGSTYAPEVASQGLQRMQANADNAKPLFYEKAQKAYMENTDADIDAFNAAINAKKDELSEYTKRADAYNNQYQMAQRSYSDNRDFDYNKYSDNRDFWAQQYQNEQQQANYNKEYQLKEYETYSKLASVKCAEYNDKKNNKGMRSYLDGLVKNGKLTKYMADNLYNQYKYTARSSGGGSSRTKSGNNNSSIESIINALNDEGSSPTATWQPDVNVIKYVHQRNRDGKFKYALDLIKLWVEEGKMTEDDGERYAEYFKYEYSK